MGWSPQWALYTTAATKVTNCDCPKNCPWPCEYTVKLPVTLRTLTNIHVDHATVVLWSYVFAVCGITTPCKRCLPGACSKDNRKQTFQRPAIIVLAVKYHANTHLWVSINLTVDQKSQAWFPLSVASQVKCFLSRWETSLWLKGLEVKLIPSTFLQLQRTWETSFACTSSWRIPVYWNCS